MKHISNFYRNLSKNILIWNFERFRYPEIMVTGHIYLKISLNVLFAEMSKSTLDLPGHLYFIQFYIFLNAVHHNSIFWKILMSMIAYSKYSVVLWDTHEPLNSTGAAYSSDKTPLRNISVPFIHLTSSFPPKVLETNLQTSFYRWLREIYRPILRRRYLTTTESLKQSFLNFP